MKKLFSLLTFVFLSYISFSQRVGVGTNQPEMALEVKATDSAVLQLNNSTALDENVAAGVYFKNGAYYTGAIKTIGSSANTARLGFFTYATTELFDLRERLSISDGGFIGINNPLPTSTLHLNGYQKIDNTGPFTKPGLDVNSTIVAINVPGINVQAASSGIISGTTNIAGTGLLAWNGQLPAIQAGTAITAHSTNGNAIYAQSIKVNGISVLGNSTQPSVTAGRFQNSGGGKALVTNGLVQIEGQGAAAGRVLTSDASGNATWQDAGTKVAFRGYLPDNFVMSPGSVLPVSGVTELANDGSAFNANAGEFTAPANGWYQFTVNTEFLVPTTAMRFAIDFLRNGLAYAGSSYQFQVAAGTAGQQDARGVTQLFKLNAGDNITFRFRHIGGTGSITLIGQSQIATTIFQCIKL